MLADQPEGAEPKRSLVRVPEPFFGDPVETEPPLAWAAKHRHTDIPLFLLVGASQSSVCAMDRGISVPVCVLHARIPRRVEAWKLGGCWTSGPGIRLLLTCG